MTMYVPPPTAPSPFEKPANFVWSDLPIKIGRLSPSLGRALNDRAGWLEKVPALLLLIVPAAFLFGASLGAIHWGNPAAYSSSWEIVALLLGISCACGAGVGLWLTLGYAIGDYLVFGHPRQVVDTPVNLVGFRVGVLVSYIGLFLLLVMVPLTAGAARRAVIGRTNNLPLAIAAQCGAAGITAFAWAQTIPLLLRPMWVWAPDPDLVKVPPIAAIEPVQSNGLLFGVVAAIATLGMAAMPSTKAEAYSSPPPMLQKAGRALGFMRAFVSAIVFTLIFSGLVLSVFDLVVLYALIQTAALLRLAILPLFPRYVAEVRRIPAVIRFLVPIGVGMASGFVLLSIAFGDNDLTVTQLSFMPVILALGIGMIAAALANPAPALTSGQLP